MNVLVADLAPADFLVADLTPPVDILVADIAPVDVLVADLAPVDVLALLGALLLGDRLAVLLRHILTLLPSKHTISFS